LVGDDTASVRRDPAAIERRPTTHETPVTEQTTKPGRPIRTVVMRATPTETGPRSVIRVAVVPAISVEMA
jgi:hypothetical protein